LIVPESDAATLGVAVKLKVGIAKLFERQAEAQLKQQKADKTFSSSGRTLHAGSESRINESQISKKAAMLDPGFSSLDEEERTFSSDNEENRSKVLSFQRYLSSANNLLCRFPPKRLLKSMKRMKEFVWRFLARMRR
jgi:hypothetical protein